MVGLIIQPLAEVDLKHAFEWYELLSPGLGESFLEATEFSLRTIRESPHHFPVKHRKIVRAAIIPRFPYSVHFVAEENRIVVLGIFSHKRDPRIWRKRKL